MATKAKLVRIGNSRGVRLPKPFIEQAGLGDEVEILVRGNTIVIAAARTPRSGWGEAARLLAEAGGDRVEEPTDTRFEREEWQW